MEELIPLYIKNGSNIKYLIIYLNRVRENSSDHKTPSIDRLYQRITTIINELLPQLTNFHLRQRVLSQDYNFFNRPCYFSPYVEDIPYSLEHRSYRVSVAAHSANLLQNRV